MFLTFGQQMHAVIWSATDQITDLGAGGQSKANDINDAGQVVGVMGDSNAFIWSNGQLKSLGDDFREAYGTTRPSARSSAGRKTLKPLLWENDQIYKLQDFPPVKFRLEVSAGIGH